ncbi:MAG: fasciclin domain-containing protein [Brevundimonas sp.]|uniref:fasciclin domain-containing protein n=1 Tax=Brevundimonas sp. TaxID=1871086 RepID=UPI00391C8CF4
MNYARTFAIAVSATALVGLAACGEPANNTTTVTAETDVDAPVAGAPASTGTIVEVAQSNNDFETLVAAVQAAGLVDTLNGSGPFTVFAPTDAAFEKLPAGTVENLTQPAQRNDLQRILTYHVVPGNLTAADLASQAGTGGEVRLTTVQGGTITLRNNNGTWQLTDAAGNTSNVVIADVAASNGVIHAIDTVVMPG